MKTITTEEKIIEILNDKLVPCYGGRDYDIPAIEGQSEAVTEIIKLYKPTLCTCPTDKQRIEKINCCNACGKLIENIN